MHGTDMPNDLPLKARRGAMSEPAALSTQAATTEELAIGFKAAMRQLAAGVTVVSTSHAGKPSGLTVTAVCSLTADPPTLLICVNRSAQTHRQIALSSRFRVNVLADHQREVAEAFAGAKGLEGESKFAFGTWNHDEALPPRLEDCLASIDCLVTQELEVGTHTVFIGRVQSITMSPLRHPLIYAGQQFRHLTS